MDRDLEAQSKSALNHFDGSSTPATSRRPKRPRTSIMPSLLRYKLLCVARISNSKLISKVLTLVVITLAGFWTLCGMPYPDTLTAQRQPAPPLPTQEAVKRQMEFEVEYGRTQIRMKGDEYTFEWPHWVNLTDYSNLNTDSEEEKETFLLAHVDKSTFAKPPKIPGSTAQWRRLGQTYLREHAPQPAKVVDLGESKTYVLRPKHWPRKPRQTLIKQVWKKAVKMARVLLVQQRSATQEDEAINMPRIPEDYQSQVYKVYKEIENRELLGPVPALAVNRQPLLPNLNSSLFEFNISDHLVAADDQGLEAKFHAQQTATTLAHLPSTPKHFNEIWLARESYLSVHYDWRFFRQIRKGYDSHATLHHLVQAWSAFARNEGLVSWIAHGTLIGWRWNGLNLDWDSDIDIQMPVQELDVLARRYNNTLVVQDPKDGTGRYLIDVAPAYVERTIGNGNNMIDARFIDIRSGLFLDITGLAMTPETVAKAVGFDEGHAMVGCKNKHVYRVEDILPLRQTLHEGAPVYIPNAVDRVLSREYNSFLLPAFQHYRFHTPLRLWMGYGQYAQCQGYLEPSLRYSKSEVARDNEEGLTLYGACESYDVLAQFKRTSRLTWVHAQEISYWEGLPHDHGEGGHRNNSMGTGMLETGWQGSHEQLVRQYEDLCAGYVAKAGLIYESPRYLPESVQDV